MNLNQIFAILKPDLRVETAKVSPTIYEELDAHFDNFKSHVLISSYRFESDWPTWEKHPAGDEVVVLLSGAVRMVLKTDEGEETVELNETGDYLVVPCDTWHTAHVSEPTHMLFITPGEGTENSVEVQAGNLRKT